MQTKHYYYCRYCY